LFPGPQSIPPAPACLVSSIDRRLVDWKIGFLEAGSIVDRIRHLGREGATVHLTGHRLDRPDRRRSIMRRVSVVPMMANRSLAKSLLSASFV
jgi:hypothetical protein